MNLIVSIEKRGEQVIIGNLTCTDYTDARFSYAEEYLNSENPVAISVNLPLQKESFSTEQTKTFFEALLPEGFTRRSVAGWFHVDENDYISLLKELGNDCLGAIRISTGKEITESYYEKISEEDILSLAKGDVNDASQMIYNSRISLAGATGKVGLLKKGGEWFLPHGSAPSNYILKQSHVRLDSIVLNEQLCQKTAKRLGIDVPDSEIVKIKTAGEDVLFASKRYDRLEDKNGKIFRLHQEDFSQILGIPSINKYERTPDENYCKKVYEAITKYSEDPAKDRVKFWDRLIFNYTIGNADCHIKNLAMLYNENISTMRLAPLYDCLSTRIYPSSNPNAACSIGGEYDYKKMNKDTFAKEAEILGLGKSLAMARFDYITENFEEALLKAAGEIQEEGIETAMVLANRILSGAR